MVTSRQVTLPAAGDPEVSADLMILENTPGQIKAQIDAELQTAYILLDFIEYFNKRDDPEPEAGPSGHQQPGFDGETTELSSTSSDSDESEAEDLDTSNDAGPSFGKHD